MLREVKEETGLELKEWRYRAIVYFSSDKWAPEAMHLFTATPLTDDIRGECSEGVLEWVPIDKVLDLPLWEGDRVFLPLLQTSEDVFSLKLIYDEEGNLSL